MRCGGGGRRAAALLFPPYHRTDRGVRGIFYGMNGWMDGSWLFTVCGGNVRLSSGLLGPGPASFFRARDARLASWQPEEKEKGKGRRAKTQKPCPLVRVNGMCGLPVMDHVAPPQWPHERRAWDLLSLVLPEGGHVLPYKLL